ncbi:MAG: imidazole glycerol phosphate synthase subunit HisH [Pseudomonadota bacterium]
MLTALIDYDSGNLHSARKAFERMARETDAGDVIVTRSPEDVARADRIVLPGDGAFPACAAALQASGCLEALREAVMERGRPFMGICVGMQLMAREGTEYERTEGLGWIDGRVMAIDAPGLKVPHMGWNDLVLEAADHPVLAGITTGDHAYFVHSYHMEMGDESQRLAHVAYGGDVTAIVGTGTQIGTQFHPEKSQTTGLRLIANFLDWRP